MTEHFTRSVSYSSLLSTILQIRVKQKAGSSVCKFSYNYAASVSAFTSTKLRGLKAKPGVTRGPVLYGNQEMFRWGLITVIKPTYIATGEW